jgi:hypothetical protein
MWASLAHEVDDCPVILAALYIAEFQSCDLRTAETATEQEPYHSRIALPTEGRKIEDRQQLLSLSCREPIADATA